MTGKTTLIESERHALYIDLLDVDLEFKYRADPKLFWQELAAIPAGSTVIVDEIQKIPELLSYVHKAIEKLKLRFILSGSSARKLKRQAADMLAGRAIDLKLFPLTLSELDGTVPIKQILNFGSLPKVAHFVRIKEVAEAKRILRSYNSVYLKEEIQVEALVRNLSGFQRFLPVAAQSNGQMIEYANIGRECSLPSSTVKEYFEILEDTLIATLLWPWNKSERNKARPKLYFFDTGVLRAIQGRLDSEPSPQELGHLFETWFINEVKRTISYGEKELNMGLWRNGHNEIDLTIERNGKIILGIEVKSGSNVCVEPSQLAFRAEFPKVPLWIVSLDSTRKRVLSNDIEVLSAHDALDLIRTF